MLNVQSVREQPCSSEMSLPTGNGTNKPIQSNLPASQPVFKVGDKVVIGDEGAFGVRGHNAGKSGTVVKVDVGDSTCEVDIGDDIHCWYKFSALRHAEYKDNPAPMGFK